MQKHFRNSILLILPFCMLVLLNENSRLANTDRPYQHRNITAINSEAALASRCTWQCHHNTQHCKQQHLKYLKPYFQYSDPLYFGIIRSFKMTGNYGAANVLILVVLIPLLMYILLIKSLNIQVKIRQNRRNN